MGLTIHFSLRLPDNLSLDEVTAAIAKLWQAAKALPFQTQTTMVTLDEDRIRHAFADRSRSPWRWACVQHTRRHHYRFDPHGRPYTVNAFAGSGTCSQMVRAQMLVGFTCLPGAGCEPINLFVSTYPASFLVECRGDQHGYASGRRRLMLAQPLRWTGSAFCKTQYASLPEEGGITNFLKCHLLVIAVLEAARDVGFQVEVHDEGHYWERRSIPDLVREIGDWNTYILGVGKRLQGLFDGQVQTAIDEASMAQPVNASVALTLGDNVLDLIRRTKGCCTAQPVPVPG